MKFIIALLIALSVTSVEAKNPILYNLFQTKANRLIVVTEPSWCYWCQLLEPHLKQLKDEGYDVHKYTKAEWEKAEPKPGNLPIKLSKQYSVPVVLYVKVNSEENKVVKDHGGGKTAAYIKRYLTK